MNDVDLQARLRGVVGVAVSPFRPDGSFDAATSLLLNQRCDIAGVHAMTALGNTAEVFQLTRTERIESLRTMRDGIHRAATIAGIPCGIEEADELMVQAERFGFDAVMFHEPMDPLASEAGIVTRWQQMLGQAALPAIPYVRTDRLSPAAVAEIARHPGVIAVKLARPAGASRAVIDAAGRDTCVWIAGGAEAQFLTVRDLGISGFTSGLVNVAPELSLDLWTAAEAGDEARVDVIASQIIGLEELRARERSRWNVAAIKAALRLAGTDAGEVRAPCEPLPAAQLSEVEAIVAAWPRPEPRLERGPRGDRALSQIDQHSPGCDFIHIRSSRDPGVRVAVRVLKPARPGPILATTHGWHQHVDEFVAMERPDPGLDHLSVHIDLRGRKHSTGHPDANGWELQDIIDAIEHVKQHYGEHISDPDEVHFQAGSGGGGNALALAGKYPDQFASITALYPISDYAAWFDGDAQGEFRPTLIDWIGGEPSQNRTAYATRSGIDLLPNLLTPVHLMHGSRDDRVPVEHSRTYVARAAALGKQGLVTYDELPGVGAGTGHRADATPEQLRLLRDRPAAHRNAHRSPPELPRRGRLIVAGFLSTRHFSVVLDSLDSIAVLDYDLDEDTFRVVGVPEGSWEITRSRTTMKETA